MSFDAQEPFDQLGRSPALQRYDEARRLMDCGSFDLAAELLHRSAVEEPHFKTFELLGECYIRMNRLTEAVPYLAAATTLNRGVRAPALLAETWLALKQYEMALAAAATALARDPSNKSAIRVRDVTRETIATDETRIPNHNGPT
jgi:tetratricopeptide (TPR) repeat protein